MTVITIVNGAPRTITSSLVNYCIIEIGQNTEKIPGDLKRLVITQTSVKDCQLILVGKILKE